MIDRYTMVLSVNSSVGKLLKVKEIKTGESVYLLNRSEEFRGVVGQVLEGKHENKISRLDEGGLPYQWEKLDLYSLTHDIFSTLHEAAEKQEVHMYMEGGSTVLDTVPTIMEEVLYNVCDNAVKYNHRGGEIFVRLKDGEDAVRVNVRDTGIGIPKEDQERIFERFYRVDKSHSKEIGGTGLGLSIVKHGVKTLNGRLWLNSEPGQGTEIIMEFPKHHMEKEAAE